MLSDGKTVTIDSIEVEELVAPETTYNFEVADFHTYYVTDSKVLVHNTCVQLIYIGQYLMKSMGKYNVKLLCTITLIIVIILSSCSGDHEREITDYKDYLSQTEYTDRLFPPINDFFTTDIEFYRYYINEISVSNETFLKLTYTDKEVFTERFSYFFGKHDWKETPLEQNDNYRQFFLLPATVVSGGKKCVASYTVDTFNDEKIILSMHYSLMAVSENDKTIVFYNGNICDNYVFKHKPKYFSYFNIDFDALEEGEFVIPL